MLTNLTREIHQRLPEVPEGLLQDLVTENVDASLVARALELSLAEDLGTGDLTTTCLVPEDKVVRGSVVYKQAALVAGLNVFAAIFQLVDPDVSVSVLLPDGTQIKSPPQVAAILTGPARSILAGERTALNFLQRLSGIATGTRKLADLVGRSGVALLDTRKTTPGLRVFEKYAVRVGGGKNHRFGLFDAVLIKDNHLSLAGGVGSAVSLARKSCPGHKIEVETTTLDEVGQAVAAGADVILLDNMEPGLVCRAIELIAGRCLVEVSGGINAQNIHQYLVAGVDAISVGALTHSAMNIDISLEVET